MDRGAGMREAGPTSANAALVEAVRGAPAALFQFRLSPSGAYALPFASPDFVARYGIEQGEPEETAARFFSRVHPDARRDLAGDRPYARRPREEQALLLPVRPHDGPHGRPPRSVSPVEKDVLGVPALRGRPICGHGLLPVPLRGGRNRGLRARVRDRARRERALQAFQPVTAALGTGSLTFLPLPLLAEKLRDQTRKAAAGTG